MASIRSTLVTQYEIGLVAQQMDELAFALVSPLCADDSGDRHHAS
jgi:hypothetical protein